MGSFSVDFFFLFRIYLESKVNALWKGLHRESEPRLEPFSVYCDCIVEKELKGI